MASAAAPPVQQATEIPPVSGTTTPAAAQSDPAMARMEQQLQQTTQQVSTILDRLKPPAASADDNNRAFYKEPLRMSQAIAQQAANEAVNNFAAGQFDTLIAVARDKARSRNAEIFDRYTNEIEQRVLSVDPQFRTNITVWNNAVDMVAGAHVNDILKADREASPRAPAVHISSDGAPARSSGHQPPAPKGVTITPEEKEMIKGLRLTEEAYVKGKEAVDLTNYGRADSKDNAFDSVVTFDSTEAKRRARLTNAKK